jgi:hypothetical protein
MPSQIIRRVGPEPTTTFNHDVKRVLKFAFRLGVVAAVIAIVIRVLDDEQTEQPPLATPEPPAPPAPPKPAPEPPAEATVAWVEPDGTVCPTSHPIKAKASSKVFRKPGTRGYDESKPDRCYASEDAAVRDGFREAKR